MEEPDRDTLSRRVRELEAELAAARRTIAALVRRSERLDGLFPAQELALVRSISGLEEVLAGRMRELNASDRRFQALFDQGPDLLMVVDRSGRIRSRNRAAMRLGAGARLAELFEDRAEVQKLAEGGFLGAGDIELRLRDGRMALLAAAPIELDGEALHQVVLRDVTSYRLLSDELQSVRRLAAVGNLAASVAHEINNPLAVLLGRVELLEALLPGDAELVRRHLSVMADHAHRIASIVKSLQAFARPGLGTRSGVGLARLVERARRAAGRRLGQVEVSVRIEPEDLATHGDPVLLEQVLVALLGSAADALGRRGRVEVEGMAEGGSCVLLLRHRTTGWSSGRYRDRAREPWSGGPGPDQAVGFGVSVASAIVREHGGRIEVTEEDGHHAVLYRVRLPLVPGGGREEVGARFAAEVLLVEDDEALREVGTEMLASAGHRVLATGSAEEALVELARRRFDIVLADVKLPGLSGIALREAAAARWPGLEHRFVVVTGSTLRLPEGVPALRKPYSREELLRVVEEIAEHAGRPQPVPAAPGDS